MYVFVHRSFQEYFSADAITGVLSDKMSEFLQGIGTRAYDSVLPVAYEIQSELVVRTFVVPGYKEHLEPIRTSETPKEPFKLAADVGLAYVFSHGGGGGRRAVGSLAFRGPSKLFEFVYMIRKMANVIEVDSHPAFGPEVYNLHRKCSELCEGLNEEITVEIAFEPRDVVVTPKFSRRTKSIAVLEARIGAATGELKALARVVAETARQNVDSARHWCQARIKESERRAKSIDQILGLGAQ
jgi:hypothetical protein